MQCDNVIKSSHNGDFYTFLGCIGIFFWSTYALMVDTVQSVPTFEILSIAFSISFLLTALKLTIKNDWQKVKHRWSSWVGVILGIFGNEACFIMASKSIPVEQVTIIFYTWPILVFLASFIFLKEKIDLRYLLACILGLSGVAIALSDNPILFFQSNNLKGYSFAFLSSLVWSCYTVNSRHFKNLPYEVVGLSFGFCAGLSIIAHLYFEPTVLPSQIQLFTLCLMGLTTQGLAYILWDRGIKKGNYNLLYVLAYCNPVLAIVLLILFTQMHLTMLFMVGASLLIFSNYIVRRR